MYSYEDRIRAVELFIKLGNRVCKTRDIARVDVFDYVEAFYNRNRRHSHLGGISPEAFKRASI